MLNWLWGFMIIIGIVYALITGNIESVTQGAFDSAKEAVTLCITMFGIMAFWCGLMEIADSNIVVPVGPAIKDFNGMITLNDSASFFWDCMINETTEEEVIEKVINEYDIDKETAKRDIEKFIKMLEDNKLLEK